jgi:hypothetical protein
MNHYHVWKLPFSWEIFQLRNGTRSEVSHGGVCSYFDTDFCYHAVLLIGTNVSEEHFPPSSEFNLNGKFFPMTITSFSDDSPVPGKGKTIPRLNLLSTTHWRHMASGSTAPPPCRFKCGENSPRNHCIGCRVGPRIGPDVTEEKEVSYVFREPNPNSSVVQPLP